ncbi:hypothetical protein [Megamonas funiformis]|uniref:hypothetical protein n=1 Tax=Megamonas funiformis TaxID=437897 RepID=UPI0022E0197F|nr:hypothetical protein [Megamonas funiformis]
MSMKQLYTGVYKFMGSIGKEIKSASGTPNVTINKNHTLVIQDYDHDLKDYLNRSFPIGVMCNSVRSTGYPHAWNEQKAIPQNTKAVDPQKGLGSDEYKNARYKLDTISTEYQRDNWQTALPRCHITGIEYSFFETQMQKNYGSFNEDLLAKDTNDMFVDYQRTVVDEFWNGDSPTLNDTTKWTYMGILNQIKTKTAIKEGTIAENIQSKIAEAQSQTIYLGRPNVLCMNPITYDLLCKEEAKNEHNLYQMFVNVSIVPGVEVPAIRTQIGTIPIHLTPFIKVDTSGSTQTHKIVALNTKMIDRVWLFWDAPKMFVTQDPNQPLNNPALMQDKNLINFDTYILHGVDTPSHFILTKDVTVGE